MSKVHVSLHRDAAHGKAAICGPMRFAPSKRRSAGQDIILPAGFDVDLVDGEAIVELDATGPDWCWCAYEPTLRGAIRHFLVPDVPDDEVLEYEGLPDVEGNGIGLANTRARLQALYGDDASLSIEATATGGTRVSLRLPRRQALQTVDFQGNFG